MYLTYQVLSIQTKMVPKVLRDALSKVLEDLATRLLQGRGCAKRSTGLNARAT